MTKLEIETERLRLRQFVAEDLEELTVLRTDPEVMRYIGSGAPQDLEQTRAWLTKRNLKSWAERGFGMWAVELKGAPRLLGWCGLGQLDDTEEVEVGYGLAREFWGRGLISEAAHASLRYGFEQLRLDHIAAVALPENAASRRVMEKLGMKYVRRAVFYGADVVYYSITREEFQPGHSPFLVNSKS